MLCHFLSLVYCQESTWFIESKNVDAKTQGAVNLTLNRQLLVPARSMARSINGGNGWNDTEQLLIEAEAIILDLQADRDDWQRKTLYLETLNRDLQYTLEIERKQRYFWMGTGVSSVIVLTIVVCMTCFS